MLFYVGQKLDVKLEKMASVMLVLCGVATLAGPNGTAPALENRRIEINPPHFPGGDRTKLVAAPVRVRGARQECI